MHKLVLLSGGLDSAVAAKITGAAIGLFVDYGQPARLRELNAAEDLSAQLGLDLQFAAIAGFPAAADGTVYPARNLMLLSLGAAVAASNGAGTVVIGCTAADFDGFVDCRGDYLRSAEACLDPFGVKIQAPLLYWSRNDVKEFGRGLVNSWSCYNGGSSPCGRCASCLQ